MRYMCQTSIIGVLLFRSIHGYNGVHVPTVQMDVSVCRLQSSMCEKKCGGHTGPQEQLERTDDNSGTISLNLPRI